MLVTDRLISTKIYERVVGRAVVGQRQHPVLIERVLIELMTSDRQLEAYNGARNEGATRPKRLDDT